MKKNNPHTPIMIREALGIEPKVFARYGMWETLMEKAFDPDGSAQNMGRRSWKS